MVKTKIPCSLNKFLRAPHISMTIMLLWNRSLPGYQEWVAKEGNIRIGVSERSDSDPILIFNT